MDDFFEIDFLWMESKKSGDSIPIRYRLNGVTRIHITDGGFQDFGKTLVNRINKYYDNPEFIDAVIVTHPDGDHAGGLRTVLDEFEVSGLWMLRPWLYANELIDRFSRYTSADNLAKKLKEIYPNVAALEELANLYDIPIFEPFQGTVIGDFVVLAPTKERYLDLIVSSEKTPESKAELEESLTEKLARALRAAGAKATSLAKAAWGVETFSSDETSAENDMSIIQFAILNEKKILLTGDAGRGGLKEAADFADLLKIPLPGIHRFQIPHHGSRRNVSSELLDRWLGPKLPAPRENGSEIFSAIVSASEEDADHPKNAVVRAMIHRGAKVLSTETCNVWSYNNAPKRDDYGPIEGVPYPTEEEN